MGVAMTLFGVTYALVQTDMRRLLSYHIQSQVGYMVVGVVSFFLVRKRLARVKSIPGVDTLYNPAAFYGLRTVVDTFGAVASGLIRGVGEVARTIREIATAVDPVSRATGGRVRLPSPFGIDVSVMLLALFAVFLLSAVLA